MLQPCGSEAENNHVVHIPLAERWRIHHRLQELMIPCWCPPDGSLRVQVNNCLTAIQLRSIVLQFTATRQELIYWLERCWEI
jgi:hypothetical protein